MTTTVRMSDDDLDGIAALTEACKPWNPLREASEALIDEVRRLRSAVDAVLALHRPLPLDGRCRICIEEPCETVRTLTQ
jgi:hypothetical protein